MLILRQGAQHGKYDLPFSLLQELLNSLGRMDAICSFLHIAAQKVRATMAEQPRAGEWLSGVGHQMNVVIDHVDEAKMPTRLAELYILAVYTHWVEFGEATLLQTGIEQL